MHISGQSALHIVTDMQVWHRRKSCANWWYLAKVNLPNTREVAANIAFCLPMLPAAIHTILTSVKTEINSSTPKLGRALWVISKTCMLQNFWFPKAIIVFLSESFRTQYITMLQVMQTEQYRQHLSNEIRLQEVWIDLWNWKSNWAIWENFNLLNVVSIALLLLYFLQWAGIFHFI